MVDNASKLGAAVTVDNDSRITKVGAFLRKYRMDEFPQLFNILAGDMTLVGTRPEVPKYVKKYTKEMYATLLCRQDLHQGQVLLIRMRTSFLVRLLMKKYR